MRRHVLVISAVAVASFLAPAASFAAERHAMSPQIADVKGCTGVTICTDVPICVPIMVTPVVYSCFTVESCTTTTVCPVLPAGGDVSLMGARVRHTYSSLETEGFVA